MVNVSRNKNNSTRSFISVPIPTEWNIVDEDGTTRSLQTYNPEQLAVLWVKIREACLFTSNKRASGLTVVALTWYKDPISHALLNAYEVEVMRAAAEKKFTFTTTYRIPKEKLMLAENCCLLAGVTRKKVGSTFDIYIIVRDKDDTNWVLKYQLDGRFPDEWRCVIDELGLKLPKL